MQAELLGGFDGGHIGGGLFIAHRPAILVRRGLGEHAADLDLTGLCRLTLDLAHPALCFRLHHGHACAVHLDVEHRYRGGADLRQLDLFGAARFRLLARGYVVTDHFGLPFDGFRGDLQTGQQLQLFAALVEADLAAHQCHHAAHAGRTFIADDTQFLVAWTLAAVTTVADIVSPLKLDRAQSGDDAPGPVIVIAGLGTADATNLCGVAALLGQQVAEQGRAGPMQARAGSHLHSLQVQTAALALCGKDYLEECLDFPCDFLMNCNSRFFSASVQPPSSGSTDRRRQICSLTAVNWADRSWKR